MSRSFLNKRYWMVGVSEGLGREVAKQMSAAGASLILSARNTEKLEQLKQELPGEAIIAPCDIQNQDSVDDAFTKAHKIDGLIFCAGVYEPLSAKTWDKASIELMCDVNFTGAARVLGAALPSLVEQGHGHIVMIGSLSGFRGLPGAAGYGASKAGMMHIAQSLRADLPSPDFDVQLINPGFIKTRLTDKNNFSMAFIMSAEQAGDRVMRAMSGRRFETSFPTRFALFFKALSLLPNGLYYPFVRKFMTT